MDQSLIDLLKENPLFLGIAGIVVLTTSLILHHRKRARLEAEKTAKRRAAIKAAKDEERKRQEQTGTPIKIKPGSLASDRMPLPEPYQDTFSGTPSPRHIAKWETEIHQIGRQMIGQIDSKMVALQSLTLEANRTANRLELLLEQIEKLTSNHFTPQESKAIPAPPQTEVVEKREEQPEIQPNLIQSGEQDEAFVETLADILDDLETEFEQFQSDAVEPAAPVTILQAESEGEKAEPDTMEPETTEPSPDSLRLPSSLSLSGESPLLPEWTPLPEETRRPEPAIENTQPFSLSSPRLPGDFPGVQLKMGVPPERNDPRPTIPVSHVSTLSSAARKITVTPSRPARVSSGLSIDSLYEDKLSLREAAQATVAEPFAKREAEPNTRNGSRLALRKQVEMLADYGYTANQIAQNLNITVGEVDLMLSLRN